MGSTGIPDDLREALQRCAGVEKLLVSSDYDGCIAPIVSRPEDAAPNPDSIAAIVAAGGLDRTDAAVVSGRALADLAERSGLASSDVLLIGSHGSEFESGFDVEITDDDRALLTRIVTEFSSIADDYDGVRVEVKPVSTALHVRNASPEDAEAALVRARSGPASWAGVEATEGKAVIELAVIETSKGQALDLLRAQFGSDAVIYLGDDVTDEKAFAHLDAARGDVSIKVGDGDTAAAYRIGDPDDVAAVLGLVVELRRAAVER